VTSRRRPSRPDGTATWAARCGPSSTIHGAHARARAPCGPRRRACRAARRSRGGACGRRRWPSTRPRRLRRGAGDGRCASITHSPSGPAPPRPRSSR
jgi:hypothetical protein